MLSLCLPNEESRIAERNAQREVGTPGKEISKKYYVKKLSKPMKVTEILSLGLGGRPEG